MAATFARFTQLLTIEFPYRRRSMGPMRLYMLVCADQVLHQNHVCNTNLPYKKMAAVVLEAKSA